MHNFLHSCRVVVLSGFLLPSFSLAAPKPTKSCFSWTTRATRFTSTPARLNQPRGLDDARLPSAIPQAPPPFPPSKLRNSFSNPRRRNQVDPDLVKAVIRVESGFDAKAVSSKGAMGLMQLIPATAQRFGVQNPFDPKQNIEGGTNYLKYLLDLFGGDLKLSLAAYNAGEHAVQRYGGVPTIPETQDYVRKVTSIYKTGDAAAPAKGAANQPPQVPITRYVDEYGVVHFSNVE